MKLPGKKTVFWLALGYLGVVMLLEVLAAFFPGVCRVIASRVWLFTGALLFLALIVMAAKAIYEDIRKRRFVELFGFLLLFAFFCFFIGNIGFSDVNPDAATQTVAGLDSLQEVDLRYFGTGFLGYSARQYVLNALPAFFFGRSVFTLHLGFAWLFLAGLTLCYLELRKYLEEAGICQTYALLPMYALLAFPFIAEYYRNFEQALTPVSLTLLAIGLVLRLLRTRDVVSIIAISFVGGLLVNAYTPAFAAFGLLFAFVGLYAFGLVRGIGDVDRPKYRFSLLEKCLGYKKKSGETETASEEGSASNQEASKDGKPVRHFYPSRPGRMEQILAFVLLAHQVVFFCTAYFLNRRNAFSFADSGEEGLLSKTVAAWFEFFTDRNARFFGILAIFVILFLFLALFFQLRFYNFVIAGWCFAVVFFADRLAGYTTYSKAWIIQRDMIVIPVLCVAIFMVLARLLHWKRRLWQMPAAGGEDGKPEKAPRKSFWQMPVLQRVLVGALLVAFLAAGIFNFTRQHQSFVYFRYVNPMKYALSYIDESLKEKNLGKDDEVTFYLFTDNALMTNLHDYARFLYPNAKCESHSSDEMEEVLEAAVREKTPLLICFSGQPFPETVAKGEISGKSWKDPVYNSKVTWYRFVPGNVD